MLHELGSSSDGDIYLKNDAIGTLELTDQLFGATSVDQTITTVEHNDGKITEVRYFLSSREASVVEFAKSIRSHWRLKACTEFWA